MFITGTGTDVGKTYISALIVKKLLSTGAKCAYFKMAMSGNERDSDGHIIPGDALYVKTVSNIDQELESMCPYVYEHPYSPHLASQLEGNPVDLNKVTSLFRDICAKYDYVTIEGSGGIICPIRFDSVKIQLIDFIKLFNLPCLLVTNSGLGAINSVCLTTEYMKNRDIPIKAIIFNNYQAENPIHRDNKSICELLAQVNIATCIPEGCKDLDISIDLLKSFYA